MTDNSFPADTHEVVLTVFALVPEYNLVFARDARQHQYAVTRRTQGIKLDHLSEGTRLRCVVTNQLPRILRATVVE